MSKDCSVKISISSSPLFLSIFILLFSGSFILSTGKTVYSQTENKDRQAPLHISSDKMIALKENAVIEFVGNVKATQTDSEMIADSIKIYFSENTLKDEKKENKNPAQGSIKQIVSTGNIKFTSGERKAFADKAVYTAADGTLILTGDAPKLITGTSFVTGKKITLFRDQDRVVVESDGKKRVEALLNPEDTSTEKP